MCSTATLSLLIWWLVSYGLLPRAWDGLTGRFGDGVGVGLSRISRRCCI